MTTNVVYLIHFDKPISDRHTCQHYIGSAVDVLSRLEEHKSGQGARLTQVANERGIDYRVVRTWEADPGRARQLERKLKNRHNSPKLCPVCSNS